MLLVGGLYSMPLDNIESVAYHHRVAYFKALCYSE